MSKADLYKLSNPHNNPMGFKAIIGTYEKNRQIILKASSITKAFLEAEKECLDNEEVLQLIKGNMVVWKNTLLR
jgi:hypothetical protein